MSQPTAERTRPILTDPDWLDLQDNPFFVANLFQRNEGVHDFLARRAEHPQFHWNATIRLSDAAETLAVVHTPATCSVFAPALNFVVPAYGLQNRDNPNHLLIIPQFLVENGGYELEG